MDLYQTLGVSRAASDAEIRRAYLERARASHPDRAGKAAAFQQLTHAYEVLSDPQQRAEYELTWLKCSSAFSPEALDDAMVEQAFAAAFGYSLSGASGSAPGSGPSSFESTDSLRSCCSAMHISPPAGTSPPASAPALNVDVPLPCLLEELFVGCTKRLRIDRRLFCSSLSGGFETVPEELVISVGPGWKSSTRIQFKGGWLPQGSSLPSNLLSAGPVTCSGHFHASPGQQQPDPRPPALAPSPAGKGDQHPGQPAQDITFVLSEQPHASFRRKGNDLHTCALVPLGTALKVRARAPAGRDDG
jgi:DnaJ-class molecular chaperone